MAQKVEDAAPAPPSNFAGAGLRAFGKIACHWSLTELQQMTILGLGSRSALRRWKAKAEAREPVDLDDDMVERISYVLGIYKAVNILLPIQERADRWMHTPNDASVFGGQTAIDRITSGRLSDLHLVRRYLEAELQ